MANSQFPRSAAPDAGVGSGALEPGNRHDSIASLAQSTSSKYHEQSPGRDINEQTPLQRQSHLQNQQANESQLQSQSRSVKRPRPVKSCTECRKRKLKCSRLCPCSQCQKSGRICRYAADNDSGNLSDGSDMETADTSRFLKRNWPLGESGVGGTAGGELTPGRNGDPSGRALLEELTGRMEKLERHLLGTQPRERDWGAPETIAAYPETIRGLTIKEGAMRTRFFGQSSSRVLLNLFDTAKEFLSKPSLREVLRDYKMMHNFLQDDYQKALAPMTVFVDSMMPVTKRMVDILPNKPVCDRLLAAYVDTSETWYRVIHIPTFQQEYREYWEGRQQPEAFLPQLLAVLSTASRFETKSKGLGHDRVDGVHIPTACALVRTWLDGLRGKQLTDIKTLQVEVLLLQAQRMINPRSQDSWAHLGYVIRLAMNMGLHRDPSEFEPRMTVFVGEIRRRLWFTILDMNLHLSLSCNMSCLIRESDYSCQPPRNLNDSDLDPEMVELPQSKPIDQHTDNQMQVYAAMTLGTRMKVSQLINQAENMRDYDKVLEVGSKLDRFLDDINYIFPRQGILSDAQRSQMWRKRVILDMHVRRPLLALYRPFAIGAPNAPGQISRAYLRSSMVILRYLDEIDPMLAHYQDIASMYHHILRGDILQAALSVCFYIQSALRPLTSSSALGHQGLRVSPEGSEDMLPYNPHSSILWSPSRLISTVEKTFELLIRYIGRGDTKDIVCLALVLECSKIEEPREDEVVQSLRRVLDNCYRATNLSPEKVAGHVRGPLGRERFSMDSYGHLANAYMRHETNAGLSASDDVDDWIMWDGWE